MSPAQRLRAAATRLREIVANKLTSDRREWDDDFPAGNVYGNASTCTSVVIYPIVALALADWLDVEAQDQSHDPSEHDGSPSGYALAVADAVLGGEQR